MDCAPRVRRQRAPRPRPRCAPSRARVDPRSSRARSALFRIALGLLLAFEALALLPEASALLSDRGVLPHCSLQPSLPTDSEFWSLNSASGGARWQLVLLTPPILRGRLPRLRPPAARRGALRLGALLVGDRAQPADGARRRRAAAAELFFAAFVPLGARWAVDAPGGAAGDDRPRASLGTAARAAPAGADVRVRRRALAPEWRSQYTAVYFALHVDMAVKWPALLLRRWPALCELASALTPPLEAWIGPVLLLFPVSRLRGRARLVGIALLSSLQLGFATCMVLGNFPYASTVAILPFVPSELWAVLLPRDADAEAAWQRRARLWARALRRAAAALLPAPEASATPPTPAAPLGRGSRALLSRFARGSRSGTSSRTARPSRASAAGAGRCAGRRSACRARGCGLASCSRSTRAGTSSLRRPTARTAGSSSPPRW